MLSMRRWKQLERLGLILSVTGISITSLVAGIGKIHEQIQVVETLQEKFTEQEKRVEELEGINHQQDKEIQYLKGKIEQLQPGSAPVPTESRRDEHVPTSRIMDRTAPSSAVPAMNPQPQDARAPLHIIDKLRMTISYAYRKARITNPNLAGKLAVRCVVGKAGSLAPSEITAFDPALSELAEDVRNKVRRWNFPETVTGLEEGTYEQSYFLTPGGF